MLFRNAPSVVILLYAFVPATKAVTKLIICGNDFETNEIISLAEGVIPLTIGNKISTSNCLPRVSIWLFMSLY